MLTIINCKKTLGAIPVWVSLKKLKNSRICEKNYTYETIQRRPGETKRFHEISTKCVIYENLTLLQGALCDKSHVITEHRLDNFH